MFKRTQIRWVIWRSSSLFWRLYIFGESLGGSQAPPSFWEVPGLHRKFPELPRKFFSDFPAEVLSLWNLTAIQGFPRSFPNFPGSSPNFPGSSPNFPGSSRTSPEVSPLLWETWHPLLTHENFLWLLLVSPVSRKSAWMNFGFEKVKLERNADKFGREFGAWIFSGSLKTWKNKADKFARKKSPSKFASDFPRTRQAKTTNSPRIRSAEPRAQLLKVVLAKNVLGT